MANRRSGRIVGGHQRVKAAEAEGIETLPVVWVDLDETGEKQLNLALNRISGEWDEPALAALLEELGSSALDLTGFGSTEVDELIARMKREARGVDPDDVPEPPKTPVSKRGDLYVLGKHRLLCGDSTRLRTTTACSRISPRSRLRNKESHALRPAEHPAFPRRADAGGVHRASHGARSGRRRQPEGPHARRRELGLRLRRRQARPGVVLAVKHPLRPERLVTVFAGQDVEATARARAYFAGYAPSSPSIGLMRDGSSSPCSSGTRSR